MSLCFEAFNCVHSGLPINIPTKITRMYVRIAEQVVKTSYRHSENFTSVSVHNVHIQVMISAIRFVLCPTQSLNVGLCRDCFLLVAV